MWFFSSKNILTLKAHNFLIVCSIKFHFFKWQTIFRTAILGRVFRSSLSNYIQVFGPTVIPCSHPWSRFKKKGFSSSHHAGPWIFVSQTFPIQTSYKKWIFWHLSGQNLTICEGGITKQNTQRNKQINKNKTTLLEGQFSLTWQEASYFVLIVTIFTVSSSEIWSDENYCPY